MHCLTKIFPSLSQHLPLFRFFHTHCPLLSSAFTPLLPSVKLDDRRKDNRKIVLRQAEAHLSHAVWVVREETHMEKGWRTPAKRALLERTALQYQSASGSHKQRILARFMTVTGSVHNYAMWVLLGLHGVKWLCLFFGQQQAFHTHGTISIIWTHPFGQKVR
jgi:hypothetical protein